MNNQKNYFPRGVFTPHHNAKNQHSVPHFDSSYEINRPNFNFMNIQSNDQYPNYLKPPRMPQTIERNLLFNQNQSNMDRSFRNLPSNKRNLKRTKSNNNARLENESGSSDDCILIEDYHVEAANCNVTNVSRNKFKVCEEKFIFKNNDIVKYDDGCSAVYNKLSKKRKKPDNNHDITTKSQSLFSNADCLSTGVNSNNCDDASSNYCFNPVINSSDQAYHESISNKLWQYFLTNRQTERNYNNKVQLRNVLLTITSYVFENAGLFIVGSSMNGFGTNNSDMDISLTITCEDLNQKKEAGAVLAELAKPLRNCPFIEDLQFIRATVPILKFRDKVSGVECDLNINNVDGIYNTYLLAMYNRVDWRLRPLAIYIKNWAQKLELHDASKGRLSTYTINLLVIQYLQAGCTPPVLPCLQARFPQHFCYERNASQIDMSQELPWNELRSTNNENLSELLMGFFEYYTDKFDFAQMAVSVRCGRPIPVEVALAQWQSLQPSAVGKRYNVFVEEPFSFYNVSRSLHEDSVLPRIKRCFRHSLQVLRMQQALEMIFTVPELFDSASVSNIDERESRVRGIDAAHTHNNPNFQRTIINNYNFVN